MKKYFSYSDDSILIKYRGFWWLLFSFFCGMIFFTTAKYALGFIPLVDFVCWWYGAGLVFHTFYGIPTGSISLGSINKNHWLLLLIYVIFDVSGTSFAFIAIKLMDPSIVSFLSQSQIIFTLFFGYIILKEVLNKGECFAAVIIIAGMIVMTYNSGNVPFKGAAMMIYANFVGSINLIIIRKIGPHIGMLTFARIRSISLFTFLIGYNLAVNGKVAVPPLNLLLIIMLGAFFGPFLNVISIYKSLETIPAGKLALYRSIQPLFIMTAAGIFLKILPGQRETIGGLIIMSGSIILAYFHAGHVLGWKRPLRTLRG